MNIIVLGGAGDMGSRAVRDLAAQPEVARLTIADYNEAAARRLAAELGPRVGAVQVNADSPGELRRAIHGHDVAASAIGPFYRYEAKVARAAVDAGVAYVSICDDYDAAQAVYELDDAARAKGITVLSGLGWTPGLSNVLARKAADQLDEVEAIHVAWGGSASDSVGYAVILHTIHIFTGAVPSYQEGQAVQVPAGSGRELVRFPAPVGEMYVYHLGHPEPVTLPKSFPGVRTVTLKGGLSEQPLNDLAIWLARLRLTNTQAKKDRIGKLIKWAMPALNRLDRPQNPCSAIRVDVRGRADGRVKTVAYGAADHMNNLTGLPLAIGALMLARGQVRAPGVTAPEACIPPDAFLAELSRRGVQVYDMHTGQVVS